MYRSSLRAQSLEVSLDVGRHSYECLDLRAPLVVGAGAAVGNALRQAACPELAFRAVPDLGARFLATGAVDHLLGELESEHLRPRFGCLGPERVVIRECRLACVASGAVDPAIGNQCVHGRLLES